MIFDDDTLEMLGYGREIDRHDKNIQWEQHAVRPEAPEGGWKRRPRTHRATCSYCATPMMAHRQTKKFCSDPCRRRALGLPVYARQPVSNQACGHCKAALQVCHASRKRFCSDKCRLRAHRAALAAKGLNVLGKPKIAQKPGRTPEERREAFKARYHSDEAFRKKCNEQSARWTRKNRKAS